jgi:hypothetical protein
MAKILPVQINNKEEVEGDYTVGKLLKVGSGYKLGVQVADVDALEAADAASKDTVPAPKELLDDRVTLLTGAKVADEGLDRIVEPDGSFAQLAALEAKKDEAQKSIATLDGQRRQLGVKFERHMDKMLAFKGVYDSLSQTDLEQGATAVDSIFEALFDGNGAHDDLAGSGQINLYKYLARAKAIAAAGYRFKVPHDEGTFSGDDDRAAILASDISVYPMGTVITEANWPQLGNPEDRERKIWYRKYGNNNAADWVDFRNHQLESFVVAEDFFSVVVDDYNNASAELLADHAHGVNRFGNLMGLAAGVEADMEMFFDAVAVRQSRVISASATADGSGQAAFYAGSEMAAPDLTKMRISVNGLRQSLQPGSLSSVYDAPSEMHIVTVSDLTAGDTVTVDIQLQAQPLVAIEKTEFASFTPSEYTFSNLF